MSCSPTLVMLNLTGLAISIIAGVAALVAFAHLRRLRRMIRG